MTPEPGKIIGGKYLLVKPLASGGMGSVWVARHTGLDVEVAVKLMMVTLAESPVARSRFEREAKAAARLKSPHVVHVHDFGVEDGAPYIAMELLQGEDLGALLDRSKRLSPARAAAIFTQACKGIKAAHDAGVVHRDIKPSNIFLARMGDDEVVKILDFGIARASEATAGVDKTASGVLVGTPHFMSPEQASGSDAGPATDLWSLAVVLFMAVTGKLPFSGSTLGQILASVLRDPPEAPSHAAPGLPPSFDPFFEKAMAKGPEQRFSSATTMAEAFAALAAAEPPETVRAPLGHELAEAPPIGTIEAAQTLDAKHETPSSKEAPSFKETFSARETPSSKETFSARETPSSKETLSARETPSSKETLSAKETPSSKGVPGPEGKLSSSDPEQPATPAPSRRRDFRARKAVVGILSLSVAAAAGALGWRRFQQADTAPSAPVAIAAAPGPTAITDLPPPVSSSPQALALYAAALQAMRDANWDRAAERLREAVSLDPSFAAAHLRLALYGHFTDRPAGRNSYARAFEGRQRLSERDRKLLAVCELLLREPVDPAGVLSLLREAVDRYPLDAELLSLCAIFERDHEAALELNRHAIAQDASYADAWQGLANALREQHRFKEAVEALDHCLTISSTSVDCLTGRAETYQKLGRCADMEADYRQALAQNPKGSALHEARIDGLMWLGRSPEALMEAYHQKWAVLPDDKRPVIELADRAAVDTYSGQFARVVEDVREIEKIDEAQGNERRRSWLANLLIEAAKETGRDRDAAHIAETHLKRREAFQVAEDWETMQLLRVMVRGGLLTKEAYGRRREEWLSRNKVGVNGAGPWDIWLRCFVGQVELPEEANEAMAAFPKEPPPDAPSHEDTEIGRMLVLAGRPQDAITVFRRAKETCNPAYTDARSQWSYGQALEQTKDNAAACTAYAAVLERWGAAVPRSITAEKARARIVALRCGK